MRKKFLIDKHLSQGSSPSLHLRELLPAKALPLLPDAAATLPSSVPSMVLLWFHWHSCDEYPADTSRVTQWFRQREEPYGCNGNDE